jgi:TonB family protein
MRAFSPVFFLVAGTALLFAVASSAEPTPRPALPKGKALAIYAPAPKIPAEARARHLSGAGVCLVFVRPDGTVSRAEMLQSTGQPILDKVSIDAFSKWRFRPGTVNQVKIPIRYTGNYPRPPNI